MAALSYSSTLACGMASSGSPGGSSCRGPTSSMHMTLAWCFGGHLSQSISPKLAVMPGHRDISLENVLVSFDRTSRRDFTGYRCWDASQLAKGPNK